MAGEGRISPHAKLAQFSRARIGATVRGRWRALSRAGRAALWAVAAFAVLAGALGFLIPRFATRHALNTRMDAIASLARVLEREDLVPPLGEHFTGETYRRFAEAVDGFFGEDVRRIKLWNAAGEIVFSDETNLVGRRFGLSGELRSALDGRPSSAVVDPSTHENLLDAGLGPEVLEFYVPLTGDRGEVAGVLEVYEDAAGVLVTHMAAVRRVVWLAVGTGLFSLLLVLFFIFRSTTAAIARERDAAEARAEDLEILLRTSRVLSSRPTVEETAAEVLSELRHRLDLRCAAVLLDDDSAFVSGEGRAPRSCPAALKLAVAARDEGREMVGAIPATCALARDEPGSICAALAAPFRAAPDLAGALVVGKVGPEGFETRERLLVSGVASQLGAAAESAKRFTGLREVTAQREQLLRRLVSAQEEERRHLVGDLHDGLGQGLTRVLFGLRGARARLPDVDSDVAGELAHLESLVESQSRGLRKYMAAIRPEMLEDFGLTAAVGTLLRDLELETGLRIHSELDRVGEVESAAGLTLFRAAQEAVVNVRHADAQNLWVRLIQDNGEVVLEVRDDGKGMAEVRRGIGLTYMEDRVTSLGGSAEIATTPGEGTTVTIRVPANRGDRNGSAPDR